MEHDLLVVLRDALTLAIEKSEENIVTFVRDERGELALR